MINSWDMIPGAPKDEFDGLNLQVLSNLYQGADLEKISRVLKSELIVTYGLYTDEFNSLDMATEIIELWNSKHSNEFED